MSSNSISTLALLAASCCTTSAVAEVGGSSSPSSSCLNLTASFPAPLQGTECWGLAHTPTGPLGNPIKSADECGSACCASTTCTVYNFKAPIGPTTGCWTGTGPMSKMQCKPVGGWVGRGGRGQPPPPPPPPPCPQSAGSLALCQLPAAPSVSPLPFSPEPSVATAPDGTTFGADSKSLLLNSSRYYPVSGEVHLARLPAEQWVEQLMRMKAGGLDMIAVYVFWIHHEEKQGMFDFTGRRDVRRFVSIAKSVGLKILMRIGPWDHGECRNGGHPDWVLTSCGRVRSTDPKYLACVEGWYAALGAELKGYYHKDGGPIVITQVDNETPNWKFLLALRQLGLKHGIEPTFYSKTGWPSPGPGYPADYPMLPYFGGYADLFWTSAMTAQPSSGMYAFAGDKAGNAPSQVPAGYPYLGVEIGGGMAAAYNHRTHMFSEDMPSMHLVDVADSFNGLGYYMYHGGNNPHSTIWTHNRDAPNTTLQESSFQPAGPANPMPSESYDFFAPLGEFGQPRRHYHQMRRLHNMIQGWGTLLASTAQTLPVIMPSAWNDNTTVRWSVRTDNNSAGFLFVNNYQRLFPLPIHTGVRFSIMGRDGSTLTVPSAKSPPVSVLSGAWFAWPLNIPLLPEASSATKPKIAWATAQLAARVDAAGLGSATTETIFLLQIDGATPEVALANVASSALTVAAGKATATQEGEHTVLRGIATGTSEFASVKVGQSTVVLVLLPWDMRDRVWVHDTLERPTVLISEPMNSDTPVAEESERYGALLLAGNDSTTLHVRSERNTTSFWICPHHSSLGEADGVFTKHTMSMTQVAIPTPAVQLTKPAAPPRKVVIAPSHKAQEPTAEEWAAAAEYTLTLSLPEGWKQHGKQTTELTLAIDYSGDAARIYYNDRLLTDNWYSGYRGEGAMEVGLTYLAGENPGLLTDGAELTLLILPLKRSTIDGTADPELEGQVFIQQSYWPEFGGNESVLDLHGLSWVQTAHIPLSIY